MPIPSIDPVLVPFKLLPQRWGDLDSRLVPHPQISLVPFKLLSQRWGDLVEHTPPVLESTYDPESNPFVIVSDLNPSVGQIDVPVDSAIYIPCGDVIATSEDTRVSLFDLYTDTGGIPETLPPFVLGINNLETVITVQYGTGTPVVAFESGFGQNGWVVSVNTNDQAGPHRGISGVGRNYSLVPPASLPSTTLITVVINLVDFGNNEFSYSYSFTTKIGSIQSNVSELFVVAKNVLLIVLSTDVVDNRYLRDVSNYVITNLSGGPDGVVRAILPTYSKVTKYIFIQVDQLVPGQTYQFRLLEKRIYSPDGFPVGQCTTQWTMHKTKVDLVLNSLSIMDTNIGSTLRSIVEAVMISDEKIGGDF
jgi:hypothetical protein